MRFTVVSKDVTEAGGLGNNVALTWDSGDIKDLHTIWPVPVLQIEGVRSAAEE